jgi:hypothetical protein
MKRKQRSDSATAAVAAAQSSGAIIPPAHVRLRDCDHPFWLSIVNARARENWTAVDLENAANLARCKADIERIQAEITAEGDTVVNQRGTQIVNPKHLLLETLTRRCMALSRILHVHAEATVGEARAEKKQNQLAVASRKVADDDEGLLARAH